MLGRKVPQEELIAYTSLHTGAETRRELNIRAVVQNGVTTSGKKGGNSFWLHLFFFFL